MRVKKCFVMFKSVLEAFKTCEFGCIEKVTSKYENVRGHFGRRHKKGQRKSSSVPIR